MNALAKAEQVGGKRRLPSFGSATIVDGALQLGATTEDHDLIMQAFGTVSEEFCAYAVGQLLNLFASVGETDMSRHLRIALATIAGIAPTNEAEAMLAVQMVGAHHAAMEMTRRSIKADTLEGRNAHGNLSTKFSRTYLAQYEGLAKVRRGGEQVVKHVHVNEGGQAIVAGTINQGTGGV